jgi:hypothetical protein
LAAGETAAAGKAAAETAAEVVKEAEADCEAVPQRQTGHPQRNDVGSPLYSIYPEERSCDTSA